MKGRITYDKILVINTAQPRIIHIKLMDYRE